MWGVRDPQMLIKVKKIYMEYFCTKTHHLSPLGKNISNTSFLNHPKKTFFFGWSSPIMRSKITSNSRLKLNLRIYDGPLEHC